MRQGIRYILLGLMLCVSIGARSVNWVPIGSSDTVIFIPYPELSGIQADTFHYGPNAIINLDGFGVTSAIYYKIRQWDKDIPLSYGNWNCQPSTTLTTNNNTLTLGLTSGRYQVKLAPVMANDSCDIPAFEAGDLLSGEAHETEHFMVINDTTLTCTDANSAAQHCLLQDPSLSNQGNPETAKELLSYDLRANWPVIDDVEQYKVTLEKDLVPYTFDVTPAQYGTISAFYLIDDQYFEDTKTFTLYTGFGQYSFKVQYCFANQCSKAIEDSNTELLKVDPLYPAFFWGETFDNKTIKIIFRADKRTPYHEIYQQIDIEGQNSGFIGPVVNLELALPDAQTVDPSILT